MHSLCAALRNLNLGLLRPLLEGGRFYALFDVQDGSGEQGEGDPEDRNVVLRIAWPPEVADALALLPQREVETFNFAVDE